MQLDDITVVIPTKNEMANTPVFLQSLPEDVFLIVVDASQDRTPKLINDLRPERTLVIRHPGNITEARQLGAYLTTTPWILFSDADVHFSADYFSRVGGYQDWDLVYGAKLSRDEYVSYYRNIALGQQILQRVHIPAASGSNLLIHRTAFSRCGGFDLRLNVNEDSELGWRVKRNGFKTTFAPDLIVYAHDHRRLRRGTWKKTLHSLVRCMLLYLNCMPPRLRSQDWGYWNQQNSR
ncbi:MAG: glycosyltransferase [Chloroflexi bacterium]|nr:glycosyltransferase [Anaerolineaceae bacterium]NMB87513.1 glycosyltransferase [Chloroflexota bacterium]